MELFGLLPLALIFFFFVIVIIEIHLCEKWSPYYFDHGLIIYRKQFNVGESDVLNDQFVEGKISKGFKFNKQPNGNIFFRERYFTWWPILFLMHGVIIIKNDSISILGRLNLLPIALLILFMALELYYDKIALNSMSGMFGLILFLFIIYLFQVRRYNKIARLTKIQGKKMG